MTEQEIANWLRYNPTFFERHAELLANVQLTSPHGTRAVPLQQRQMELLREKNRGLELRVADMMRHGGENDRTQRRLNDWLVQLLKTSGTQAVRAVVTDGLRDVFELQAVALRTWNEKGMADRGAGTDATAEGAAAIGAGPRAHADQLLMPYCGPVAGELATWFDATGLHSMAMIALRDAPDAPRAFGLLMFGSSDPRRFHDQMGTEYLRQIGEFCSAALSRARD